MADEFMSTSETIAMFDKYVFANYTRNPMVIVKGKGSVVWDADGKKYLDFFPGWAVSGIGHCHPRVVKEELRREVFLLQQRGGGERGGNQAGAHKHARGEV